MSETITVCPECDSSRINRKIKGATPSKEGEYLCEACYHHFNEPIEREPKNGRNATGTAKQLLEADPDNWP
jgi:transposase-like protein